MLAAFPAAAHQSSPARRGPPANTLARPPLMTYLCIKKMSKRIAEKCPPRSARREVPAVPHSDRVPRTVLRLNRHGHAGPGLALAAAAAATAAAAASPTAARWLIFSLEPRDRDGVIGPCHTGSRCHAAETGTHGIDVSPPTCHPLYLAGDTDLALAAVLEAGLRRHLGIRGHLRVSTPLLGCPTTLECRVEIPRRGLLPPARLSHRSSVLPVSVCRRMLPLRSPHGRPAACAVLTACRTAGSVR